MIKAIIYGKNLKNNRKIEIKEKNEYYYSLKNDKKVNLRLINENLNLIIKNIKTHPFQKKIIHIDFWKNE